MAIAGLSNGTCKECDEFNGTHFLWATCIGHQTWRSLESSPCYTDSGGDNPLPKFGLEYGTNGPYPDHANYILTMYSNPDGGVTGFPRWISGPLLGCPPPGTSFVLNTYNPLGIDPNTQGCTNVPTSVTITHASDCPMKKPSP